MSEIHKAAGRRIINAIVLLVTVLTLPAVVGAMSIRQDFESQTLPSTDTPPAGWTFINPENQAGSFYEAVTDNGSIVGRIKADVVVNGFYPAGYIASTTSVSAQLPFSGTFDMFLEDEGDWSDGVFMIGDIAEGLTADYYFIKYQGASGTTLVYDSDYPDDSRVIMFDTGLGVQFATWYTTSFSWVPTDGTTGTFSFEVMQMDGTVVLGGSGELTLPEVVQFGFGSSNDAVRVDNIAINYLHPGQAADPYPVDGDADAPAQALTLSWTAGKFAASHDVYFGQTFEDVNAATQASAEYLGRQTETTLAMDDLDFNTTYYWRVDEVNAAPDSTVYKGDVWSFTAEPFAYVVEGIVAASNTTWTEGQEPENVVNGSGLNDAGEHSTVTTNMWAGTPTDEPPYIQFEFDRVYKLHEMLVWNYNMEFESFLGLGVKDATIEYSENGTDWTILGDVELAQGPGLPSYTANSTVPMEGVAAQYVRLTVNSSWGADAQSHGLSEIRFMYIPAHAREPKPADGATDVPVDATLSWRTGRDAASHEIYTGTDPDSLTLAGTTTVNAYDPGALELNTTLYWQVVELSEADAWASDVWSFSTQESVMVDDFESYIDDPAAGDVIWEIWIDGWVEEGGDPDNGGSVVGNSNSPFAEQTIVHQGNQSLPLFFDNTTGSTFSEADLRFDTPKDWSTNGIKSLVVHVYSASDNTPGRLYLKINETKVYCDVVDDILQRTQWVTWAVDLTAVAADLTNVQSLSIGVDDSGASGVVYVDTIQLRAEAVQWVEPVVPDDADPNLAAYYAFEDNVDDATGNYPLTVSGAPVYIAGMAGQAISLNGVDDHAACEFATDETWPAYGLSMWARTETLAQVQYCGLFNSDSVTDNLYDFQVDVDGTDPGNYRHRSGGGGTPVNTTMGPVTSEWVHLAASCDGVQTSIYYNGLLAATVDTADTDFGQIGIGGNRGFTNHFAGTIDEVRLYNRPLSYGEVASLAGLTETIPAL